jgi:hypothetical protein
MKKRALLLFLVLSMAMWSLACGTSEKTDVTDVKADTVVKDTYVQDTAVKEDVVADVGAEDTATTDTYVQCPLCAANEMPADPTTCPAASTDKFCVSGQFVFFADNTPILMRPNIDVLLLGNAITMKMGGCHKGCQAILRDNGSFIFPDMSYLTADTQLMVVARDMDNSDFINTVSGILMGTGNVNYEGVKGFMIPVATMNAWVGLLKQGTTPLYADADQIVSKGFFIGRIVDATLQPITGAKIVMSGVQPANTFYFNATMNGFTTDATSASGGFLVVEPALGSYAGEKEGYKCTPSLGGASPGVGSVVFLFCAPE